VSQENVEIVRRANELSLDGGLDAIQHYLDPEIEWETRWPGLPAVFHGREGVKEWAARVVEPMQVEMRLIEARADDRQRVLAVFRLHGQGRGSGVPTDMDVVDVYSLRNGMIFRRQTFYTEEEALKAVALDERAVSSANVEIVRRAIEAFNRRDFDAALRNVAPDATLDMSHSRGPDAGLYVGHDAVRRFWSEMTEPFERHTMIPDEFISHGEQVVVPMTSHMTGRGGIELESKSATVVALREGLMMRWTMYQDRSEALKAVGLEE
jgi:ketosteroid isomerase-like protein